MTENFSSLMQVSSAAELVVLSLDSTSGIEAIATLAGRLVARGNVTDHQRFVADVLHREEQFSTELPWGIAMPHARSTAVRDFAIAIGRSDEGFFWNSESEEATRLVVMLAAPDAKDGSDFIEVLSALAKALLDEEFREAMLSSGDAGALIGTFAERVPLNRDNHYNPDNPA
ncbi:MAG: PTS sugar transporter subunit IIA [Propionibacteriaceae bacterium]|jgi:fructose-specific phosphotransferase system IIA component|nr:PTS sugar transporter subunit IIA [Propionibacteriaceae bacterium]